MRRVAYACAVYVRSCVGPTIRWRHEVTSCSSGALLHNHAASCLVSRLLVVLIIALAMSRKRCLSNCSSWVWVLQKSESESVANDVRFLNPYRFDVYFHSLIIRFRDTRAVGQHAALSETLTTSLSHSPTHRLFVKLMTVMLLCPLMVGLPKHEHAHG